MEGRADYLDRPDPTRWRSGDVHDLLMTYVVTRQVDLWELAEHGVDTVRQYLHFLDGTGRLHPASTGRSSSTTGRSRPQHPSRHRYTNVISHRDLGSTSRRDR